jgi:DNA polymerase
LDFSKVPKRAGNVTTNFFQIYQNDPVSFEGMDKTILECSKCPLRNDCGEHGPTLAEGYSDAEIMVIGRNPGKNELLEGRPFVGMSGKRLDDLFREVGLTRRECWITNVCKCYSLNNRPLEFSEMTACLPYLRAEITALKPKLILAFGNEAQAAVSPYGASGITSRSGEILEPFTHGWVGDVEATVMLFPHPSAAMRSQKAEMLFQFAEKRLKVFLDGKQIKNN